MRVGLVVGAVVWALMLLTALPGAIWRGIAVEEPCGNKLRARTDGREGPSRTEFAWLPPGWRCVGSGGTTVRLWLLDIG